MKARLLIIGALATLVAGCNTCPTRFIMRLPTNPTFRATLDGGFAFRDVDVPQQDGLEIDMDSVAFPGQTGRVDGWLTTSDCSQLFDEPYTGVSGALPKCRVLLGPVAADAVSSRIKVEPGRYRLFAQAYASNTAPVQFFLELGVWGKSCAALTAPR